MKNESNQPEAIEEELINLAKYNRVSNYSYFWEISEAHQLNHELLSEKAELEYDKSNEWQNDKYYSLKDEAQKSGYIAIVFAAMYIEAAIYLGDNYIKKHLDKLSAISKLSVIMRLVTGKDIDTDSQAYEHLNRLFKYRNTLVHTKSRPLMSGEEMISFQEKCSNSYYQAIESAKCVVEYLSDETESINQDEYHPGVFGFV